MKRYLLLIAISVALCHSAVAQSPKGAEQLKAKPAAKTESNVDGKLSVLSSHIKSIGTIGKTDRYTIISARIRGLDSPNISALLAYDDVTDSLAVLASGVEPGLGVAIVNGGATVGGNFLFGSKLRPDRTSVSNNSESEGSSAKSTSEGGTAVSVSEGGDAVSVSDADAKSTSSSASSSSVKNHNNNVNAQSQSSSNNNSKNQNNGGKK
jgi:hypothetical protein